MSVPAGSLTRRKSNTNHTAPFRKQSHVNVQGSNKPSRHSESTFFEVDSRLHKALLRPIPVRMMWIILLRQTVPVLLKKERQKDKRGASDSSSGVVGLVLFRIVLLVSRFDV
ncbi:hypothetical protein AVEN_44846-1 [Araneus ventricosus]|uniref:Uncharacterized protein n=1 Tax=Araneus ventricosus TaxID=182803 RepID=A0A4Y2CJV7_ARAVE|nr:hypothetical protein AVEN_44846-1 [Araneus ventricosus]